MKKISVVLLLILSTLAFAGVLTQAPAAEEITMYQEQIPVNIIFDQTSEISIDINAAKPYHLYAPGDKTGIPLSFFIDKVYAETYEVILPSPVRKKNSMLGDELLLFEGQFTAKILVNFSKTNTYFNSGAETILPVIVKYQACTDDLCMEPAAKTLEIKLVNKLFSENLKNGLQSGSQEIRTADSIKSAGGTNDSNSKSDGTFMAIYKKNFLFAILIAFLWGVVSSLTPCVYPMIPITVAFFGSQNNNGSKLKVFMLSFIFALGIAFSFALLGLVVSSIGIDMGAIMVNPAAMGLVSLILIFFAGSLLELYEIRMPDSIMSKIGQSEQGYLGSLVMGLTMGLVAAPCVGPFAGSLLLFASTVNSAAIGFLMLFFYGIGLGMLFMAVALGARFLPKSGLWMVRLKNFFGFVLLWINLYLLQFAFSPAALLFIASIFSVITAVLAGVFSAIKDDSPLSVHFMKAAGFVMIALAIFLLICSALEAGLIKPYNDLKLLLGNYNLSVNSNNLNMNAPGGTSLYGLKSHPQFNDWTSNFDGGLKKAAELNKNIIVDFYADWCVPCHQMDKTVFSSEKFKEMTADFIKIKLDCTKPDSEGSVIKRKFGAPFMPYIIFYDKNGKKLDNYDIKGYTDIETISEIIKNVKQQ
ncbi:MAG: cytochrome c biogenesis protein CcdA [Candidatus Wallbacteria bacterium]